LCGLYKEAILKCRSWLEMSARTRVCMSYLCLLVVIIVILVASIH
jgi:hypothetical protein